MSGFSVFPALTSGPPRFSKAAQGLTNMQNATCYVNSVLQAVVHLPHVASVPIAEWKKRCGCSQTSTCWLCYFGLRVAASRVEECEDQAPSWILKRLHLLLPKSSTAKRHKSTPGNPDEVVLRHRQLSMEDSPDFLAAFIQKASPCDVSTAEGGKGIIEHIFESQMVQDVSCPDCCTSRTWTEWHTLLMPSIYNGVRCSSIQQSLDVMMAPDAINGKCDTCHKETDRSKRTRCYIGGNVILMQLDRHHQDSRKKYQEHISFPHELDMLPWMHPESPDLAEGCSVMYDLVCIIVHKGRDYTKGHNTAVCRLGPGEDGSTVWAEYDDDKPVQKMTWEETAKKQATMLMWHRRHPRQQPLATPHPCTIKAAVPGSQLLSARSKGSGADITNSSSSSCIHAPTHHHHCAQELPLPNLVDEPDAAAAVCPPSSGCPPLPPPMHHGAQSLHQAPTYPQPDAVATANEESNLMATHSSDSSSCASPPSLPHHLAASKPMSRPVRPSPQLPHRLHESKPRSRPPPSAVCHVVAQDQSGQQPQAAKSAATGATKSTTARANNSAASQHLINTRVPTTTSQLSAAASKACGAAAAIRSAKANPVCRAGASAPTGSLKTNSRARAAAANGPAKTSRNCRARLRDVAALGPANANCCTGAVAATGPPQTRSRAKAASGGSAKTVTNSRSTAAAPNRKPLPVGSRSALSTIQEGAEHGSGYSILTRSMTRANAEHATKDTASSTAKPAQRALPRKRQRAGTSDDLPVQKKIAVSQAEVEVVPIVDATSTAMQIDNPFTTNVTGRKQVRKSRKQKTAWR